MRMADTRSNPALFRRLYGGASAFVTTPASATPLACFRIGLAVILLTQALAIAGSLFELYGNRGIVQWSAAEPMAPEGVPRISWLADALAPWGVREDSCVRTVFLLYVAGLGCLLVGWRTRLAAVVAWLPHLAMNVSGNACVYGVDEFANIALFYCIWMPVGQAASADRLAGRVPGHPSVGARLSLRVLQLHLCVVYLASGLEKAAGAQWWNGEAIWRAVMRPDLGQFDFSWLAAVPWVARLACWGTLLVEVGYAFLVWPRRTRRPWALATVGLHASIAVTLGLWSFSAVMIVLNLSAFLISPDVASMLAPWPASTLKPTPTSRWPCGPAGRAPRLMATCWPGRGPSCSGSATSA
jgi:hypothetical protein